MHRHKTCAARAQTGLARRFTFSSFFNHPGRCGAWALCIVMPLAGVQARTQSVEPAANASTGVLGPIVVTASRTEQYLADALPNVTVITRDEIDDSRTRDLPSLLRAKAGVEIAQSGGPGGQTSVFMRGANSTQTLVLIDGVRVSSATVGATQISQLMTDQIERVEIVRGNVSALYGSDAMGGVIQIFTRKGGGGDRGAVHIDVRAGLGSNATRHGSVHIAGAVGADAATQYSLNVSSLESDGFSAINPAQAPGANPDRDGYRNRSVAARLEHRIDGDWKIGTSLYQSEGRAETDNAFNFNVDDRNRNDSRVRLWTARIEGRPLAIWQTKLTVSTGEDSLFTYLNDHPDPFGGRQVTRNRQWSWQNSFDLGTGHRLLAGYDDLRQHFGSDQEAYDGKGRDVGSVFAGYEGRIGRHQVQWNMRRDDHSDFGTAHSHYVGYGFDLDPTWRVLASVSTAFRAPTFSDLYSPFGGNPDLDAERARSREIGVRYTGDAGSARLALFDTRYRNLIAYHAPTFTAFNVDRARVRGVELAWSGMLAQDYRIDVNLTVQNPENQETGTQLPRRAKRHGSIAVSREFERLHLGAEWRSSGARRDTAFSDIVLDGYDVVNLTARYALDRRWSLAVRCDNVFDKSYQEAWSYNAPGRILEATLSASF